MLSVHVKNLSDLNIKITLTDRVIYDIITLCNGVITEEGEKLKIYND